MRTLALIAAAAIAAISTQVQAAPPAQASPPAQDAPPAQASPPAQDAPRGNWMQADITRQKARQLADGVFQRLDLNHDGTLTRTEAEQARSAIGGGGDRAERMIARMFGQAQSITLAQFEAQALARFDLQDLNHDGTVTTAERQQARAARQPSGN